MLYNIGYNICPYEDQQNGFKSNQYDLDHDPVNETSIENAFFIKPKYCFDLRNLQSLMQVWQLIVKRTSLPSLLLYLTKLTNFFVRLTMPCAIDLLLVVKNMKKPI